MHWAYGTNHCTVYHEVIDQKAAVSILAAPLMTLGLHVVPPTSCPVYPLTATVTCLQWILLGVGNHNITVSRDPLATWNERARSVASGRLCRVDARVGARVRSPNHPLLSHASLTYFFRDLCNCHTWHPHI